MVFAWFDADKAKGFGVTLARFFIDRVPPDSPLGDKAFARKTDEVLNKMAGQIASFKLENKLNMYKKAQLGNAFKWALRDAGFADDYTDKLTKWLMLHLS